MCPMAQADTHLEILDRPACLDLLASVGVGRVVVSLSDLPAVLPVPIVADADGIVFAVPRGTDFDRAVSGTVVAIEADLLDRLAGWSVVVSGQATPLPDDPPAASGASPAAYRRYRLATDLVTGRRLANAPIHVGGTVPAALDATVNLHAVATRSGYGAGAESMPVDECLRRLAGEEVGRLAVVVGGKPLVFPVNYVFDGGTVVFRTAAGAKLDAISRSLATFEVDRWVPGDRSGWTVSVEGFAVEVTEANGAQLRHRLAALPLFPWVPGERSHLVRVLPVSVHGRRWAERP